MKGRVKEEEAVRSLRAALREEETEIKKQMDFLAEKLEELEHKRATLTRDFGE